MKQTVKVISTFTLAVLFAACGVAAPAPNDMETIQPAYTENSASSPIPLLASPTPFDTSTAIPANAARSFPLENTAGRGTPQYSADGKQLILPTSSGIFMLNTASYQNGFLLIPFNEHSIDLASVSRNGKLIAWGNQVMAINAEYDLPDLQIPRSINGEGFWAALTESRFSPDNTLLAVFYAGMWIDIWNLIDGKLLYGLPAESMDFSPNGEFIAVVTPADENKNPRIQLYEAQTGNLLEDWSGERAVFLPDNRLALEDYGAIRIYDPSTGKVPGVFNGKFSAFSPDGRLIALLYYNQVEIHQTSDGKLLHRLPGNFTGVDRFDLRFAPDGQSLVGDAHWTYCCAGYAGSLSLWRVADGALLREFPFVTHFNFSPDSRSFVVFRYGLQIWNTADGSVRVDLKEITIP